MKYEQVGVTEAIIRTIRYKDPYPVHHDDLTEGLVPIFGNEEFNEAIEYLTKTNVIKQAADLRYVLFNNVDHD